MDGLAPGWRSKEGGAPRSQTCSVVVTKVVAAWTDREEGRGRSHIWMVGGGG